MYYGFINKINLYKIMFNVRYLIRLKRRGCVKMNRTLLFLSTSTLPKLYNIVVDYYYHTVHS